MYSASPASYQVRKEILACDSQAICTCHLIFSEILEKDLHGISALFCTAAKVTFTKTADYAK